MLTFQDSLITMFSSIGLFKQVQCPEQSHCSLMNCIFSHHLLSKEHDASDVLSTSPKQPKTNGQQMTSLSSTSLPIDGRHKEMDEKDDRPRKRRRLSDVNDESHGTQETVLERPRRKPLNDYQNKPETPSSRLPSTAIKEISPPPSRSFKTKAAEHLLLKAEAAGKLKSTAEPKLKAPFEPAKGASEVSLNPRLIANPPAPHAVRMQLITMLHDQMNRLNDEVWQSQDTSKTALRLTPQELILEALEEEENIAKQNPAVYLNVIKLRIVKLKKMKIAEWKEERLKQIAKRTAAEIPIDPKPSPRTIDTGLSTSQEVIFLSKLLAEPTHLAEHGFVLTKPSDEEVTEARNGLEAGQGWEQCDRCKIRFQVFPGRREEDGALTSGGTCSYHPAKPRRPPAKDKGDKAHRETIFACCNESIGTSIGCTTASSHVFKVSDPKRLALVMPFKRTPPKLLDPGPNRAVCFDCEMGYTTLGLELIRLTATAWPKGEELLDVLVRPLGEILDLNSQFSGVWPEDYKNALAYDETLGKNSKGAEVDPDTQLRLVESPAKARDLLFDLLTPETPLLGHALENDFNAARIIHPSIIDTVMLYPHPRGLPIRFGLKALMKRLLDRDIQTGGANGHDSKEDANAAGELVRLKLADTWKTLQKDGWKVRELEFYPPLPSTSVPSDPFGSYGEQVKES